MGLFNLIRPHIFKESLTNANASESTEGVRQVVLAFILQVLILVGGISYVANVTSLIIYSSFLLITIADSVVYSFLLYLFFSKKLSYQVKSLSVTICLYVLGIVFMCITGNQGVGEFMLFIFPIVSGLLLNKKTTHIFLALNIVTIYTISLLVLNNVIIWPGNYHPESTTFLIRATNTAMVNIAITILVALIMENLYLALDRERTAKQDIDSQRMELKLANEKYQNELIEKNQLQERLLMAQEVAGIGYFQIDINAGIMQASSETFRITGLKPTGEGVISIEDITSCIGRQFEAIKEEFYSKANESNDIEQEFKLDPGTEAEKIIYTKNRLIYDDAGRPERIIGVIQDITTRRTYERKLSESENRYRQAFDNAPGLRFSTDTAGLITNWNFAGKTVLGVGPEALGRDYREFLYDEEAVALAEEKLAAVMMNESPQFCELAYRNDAGNPVIMASNIYSISGQNGTASEVIFANTDISARKLAEKALKSSEERLKYALDATSEGIWDWEVKSDKMYLSHRFFKIIGLEENELEPTMNSWRRLLHPEDEKYVILDLIRNLSGKRSQLEIEFRLRHKSGDWIWILCRGNVVEWDDEGRPARMVGIQRDITESKRNSLVQRVVYDISNATNLYSDLEGLFPVIKQQLSKIVDTKNFFIALYNKEQDTLQLPFFIDEKDFFTTFPAGRTLTAYLIRNNVPLLLKKDEIMELEKNGIVDSVGSMPEVWMGVPLRLGNEVIGAIVIQNYEDCDCYKQRDLDVLRFVSDQVAIAIYKKQAEEALINSEEQYRTLANKLPVGVYRVMKDGKIIQANPALASMLGFESVADLKKANINDMIVSKIIKRVDARPDNSQKYFTQEVQLRTMRGELIWGRDTGTTYLTPDGKAEYFDGIIENISEWKQAEEALVESESKFRALFENMAEGFSLNKMMTDEEGKFTGFMYVEVNEALCNILGIDRQHIIGSFCSGNFIGFTEDQLEKFQVITRVGGTYKTEIFSENNEKWYSISVFSPISGYIAIIIEDITKRKWYENQITNINKELEIRVQDRTSQLESALSDLQFEVIERKRAQEELQKAKEDLVEMLKKEKELNELKTNFISMVSHEYRTPLTVILSSTYILDILFSKQDREAFVKNIEKIQSSVKEMTRLLEDVLIIGKSDGGQKHTNLIKCDIVSICDSVSDEIRIMDRNQHPIVCEYNVARKIVISDMLLLRHIIRNLLGNAVKYSSPGAMVVLKLEDDDSMTKLTVTDNGIGISGDDLPYLFEPFHRGKNVGSISGSGLGLAIVKRYVDTLMGRIRVESHPGEGSEFIVELPLIKAEN